MYDNLVILDSEQIARLYQVVDTHHRIERAIYIGNHSFKVETDKRTFIAHLNQKTVDYVINGIQLSREGD